MPAKTRNAMPVATLQLDRFSRARLSLVFDARNEPLAVEITVEAHRSSSSSSSSSSDNSKPRWFSRSIRIPLRCREALVDGLRQAGARASEFSTRRGR